MIDKDGNKREFVEGYDGETTIEDGMIVRRFWTKTVCNAYGVPRRVHINDPLTESEKLNIRTGGGVRIEK